MSTRLNGSEFDMSGLPPVPPGWRWVPLSAIAKIDGGITKDQKRKRTPSMREVPYLRVANVQRGYLDLAEVKTILADADEIENLRLQVGDILFNEGGDRDKLGRGWVWNDELVECIHQNHVFRARPNLSVVEPKFVSLHGNFFGQQWFTRTGKQTTNLASINKGVLSRFPIPVPPLDEQRRIVAKIEELFSDLDAGVVALQRAKANLKRYRAAVLKAAVEGKLTESWRAEHPNVEPASKLLERILTERRQKWESAQLAKFAAAKKQPPKNWKAKYVGPVNPDIEKLWNVPHEWCWTTIDAIAFVTKLAGFEYTKFVKYDPSGDLAVLKAENAGKDGFKKSAYSRVKSESVKNLTRSRLFGGEVLIAFVGNVGQVGLVPNDQEYFLGPNVGLIRVESGLLTPEYLELFLKSPLGVRLSLSFAKAVTQPSLSMTTIRQIPLAIPPLGEQQQTAMETEERLSQIAAAEREINQGLLRAVRLRQSILKQAFEGKLVLQEPADAFEADGSPAGSARSRRTRSRKV